MTSQNILDGQTADHERELDLAQFTAKLKSIRGSGREEREMAALLLNDKGWQENRNCEIIMQH